MARGIRGSSKDKEIIKDLINTAKETPFRGSRAKRNLDPYSSASTSTQTAQRYRSDDLSVPDDDNDEDDGGGAELIASGVEGALGDDPKKPSPAPIPFNESAASDLTKEEVPISEFDKFTFKFNKKQVGPSVIVEILRSDGKELSYTHPNMQRADEFISNQQAAIEAARERSQPHPSLTMRYGSGVVTGANGELVITSRSTRESTVIIPELAPMVSKWLAGREVEAWWVSDRGIALVTHPCAQMAVFMWIPHLNKGVMTK
jgi:hypothetical protein